MFCFCYWVVWVPSLFWILTPYQIDGLQIFFSHSIDCLFIVLIVSFFFQKLFSLMSSHLFIFAFVACTFDVKKKKNHCQDQCQGAFKSSWSVLDSRSNISLLPWCYLPDNSTLCPLSDKVFHSGWWEHRIFPSLRELWKLFSLVLYAILFPVPGSFLSCMHRNNKLRAQGNTFTDLWSFLSAAFPSLLLYPMITSCTDLPESYSLAFQFSNTTRLYLAPPSLCIAA